MNRPTTLRRLSLAGFAAALSLLLAACFVTPGKFDAALLAQLSAGTVMLPPLRKRPADIPLLVAHFLEKFGAVVFWNPTEALLDELQADLQGLEGVGRRAQVAYAAGGR